MILGLNILIPTITHVPFRRVVKRAGPQFDQRALVNRIIPIIPLNTVLNSNLIWFKVVIHISTEKLHQNQIGDLWIFTEDAK